MFASVLFGLGKDRKLLQGKNVRTIPQLIHQDSGLILIISMLLLQMLEIKKERESKMSLLAEEEIILSRKRERERERERETLKNTGTEELAEKD